MNDLRELYQQLIIDHGRKPRNFGQIESATYQKDGFNPLCGDKITVYLKEKNGIIEEVSFTGCGCAISMASASLMTEALKGKPIDDAKSLFHDFHDIVTGKCESNDQLGKLAVLSGVSAYPARVKCATLCWHTLIAALSDEVGDISTE